MYLELIGISVHFSLSGRLLSSCCTASVANFKPFCSTLCLNMLVFCFPLKVLVRSWFSFVWLLSLSEVNPVTTLKQMNQGRAGNAADRQVILITLSGA